MFCFYCLTYPVKFIYFTHLINLPYLIYSYGKKKVCPFYSLLEIIWFLVFTLKWDTLGKYTIIWTAKKVLINWSSAGGRTSVKADVNIPPKMMWETDEVIQEKITSSYCWYGASTRYWMGWFTFVFCKTLFSMTRKLKLKFVICFVKCW